MKKHLSRILIIVCMMTLFTAAAHASAATDNLFSYIISTLDTMAENPYYMNFYLPNPNGTGYDTLCTVDTYFAENAEENPGILRSAFVIGDRPKAEYTYTRNAACKRIEQHLMRMYDFSKNSLPILGCLPVKCEGFEDLIQNSGWSVGDFASSYLTSTTRTTTGMARWEILPFAFMPDMETFYESKMYVYVRIQLNDNSKTDTIYEYIISNDDQTREIVRQLIKIKPGMDDWDRYLMEQMVM